MKVAVIGADGQLGSDLVKCIKGDWTCFPLYYPDFDLTRPDRMKILLERLNCDVVINTAAYNRVDDSEDNPSEAFKLNAVAVRDLAMICSKMNKMLVHYSTDYVFDGHKTVPYDESDHPNPLNVYGVSKTAGEYFVKNMLGRNLLIRTSGLFGVAGSWGKGKNFVDAMIDMEKSREAIRVVSDQKISPTHTLELAQRTLDLLEKGKTGLYHITNEGECSWFEFAQRVFALRGANPCLIPVSSREFGAKALRPGYSVLENARLKSDGFQLMSDWNDSLSDYMKLKGYIS